MLCNSQYESVGFPLFSGKKGCKIPLLHLRPEECPFSFENVLIIPAGFSVADFPWWGCDWKGENHKGKPDVLVNRSNRCLHDTGSLITHL